MNLLRTSRPVILANGKPVVLEVSHLKKITVDLLYSFIEMWLYKNCKSPWTLEHIEEVNEEDHATHSYIRIVFKDVREALYFKLSPSFLHSKPTVPLMLWIPSKTFV
jgi:hypothetical protein